MAETQGAIFVATGAVYVKMATNAARSVRHHNPGLPVHLFTDQSGIDDLEGDGSFNDIHRLEKVWVRSKLDAMVASPFDRTLFLDADLFCLADITDIFEVLDRFEMAFTHDQTRNAEWGVVLHEMTLPNAFPQINSGVMAWKRTEKVSAFLEAWRDGVANTTAKKVRDQPFLREAMWKSDIRLAVLPPEYNFVRWQDLGDLKPHVHPAPRILHSSQFKRPELLAADDPVAALLGPGRMESLRQLLAADRSLAARKGVEPVFPPRAARLRRRLLLTGDAVGQGTTDRIRRLIGRPARPV